VIQEKKLPMNTKVIKLALRSTGWSRMGRSSRTVSGSEFVRSGRVKQWQW
jgi:hypothetical protein